MWTVGRCLVLAEVVCAQLLFGQTVVAQPIPTSTSEATRYHHLITRSDRETFDRIARYCRDHGADADVLTAVQDLAVLARRYGWEADARPIVEAVLGRDGFDPVLTRECLAIVALGAAQSGDRTASAAAYEKFLRSLRLRNPNEATDLAQSLALVWQLRADPEAARAVYEQISSAFFLNPEVRDFAAARTRRLELIGKPLPEWTVSDLSGQPLTGTGLTGKVVLLDFWATNCRPCLEELPRLRQLYRDCSPLGFEIVGLSFDDAPETLEQFLKLEPLPWRVALGRNAAEDQFQVHLIPCLMLVDRRGKVVATDVRPFDLRRTVERLLDLAP